MPIIRDNELAVTDIGAGPGFLWGHGFASSVAQESSFMLDWERLATHHRVIRWDARGHGESAGTTDLADYRWDNLGLDLIALADTLDLDGFVAGGVSMGAATALYAAVHAPERVKGLVLVLPPTAYDARAAQAGEYTLGADLVEEKGVGAYVQRQSEEPVPAILSPIAEVYHSPPSIADDLLPAALRGAGASDLPPVELVRAIEAPTLVLAWDTDPGHPLSTAELLVDLLPNAEMVVAGLLADVLSWTDAAEAFLDRVE